MRVCAHLDSTAVNVITNVIVKIILHAILIAVSVFVIEVGLEKLANKNALTDILDLVAKKSAIKMKICHLKQHAIT